MSYITYDKFCVTNSLANTLARNKKSDCIRSLACRSGSKKLEFLRKSSLGKVFLRKRRVTNWIFETASNEKKFFNIQTKRSMKCIKEFEISPRNYI